MSYILEGLKKLEQKRRPAEGAPGLLTFKEENIPRPEKPRIWPYLLFIALLLNAGVIVWWVGPWPSLERSVLTHPTVPNDTAKAATGKLVKMKKESPLGSRQGPPPLRAVTELPQSPTVEKTLEGKAPVVKKTPAPKSTPGTVPVSPESRSSLISKVVPEGRIVKLRDLPFEIKKNLPSIKMSVHFYSPDKQACFVTINDRTLREGEVLNEDLRVVEINPGGTVLNYRGHRFLIGVNEN
jgi:general secretion pathway protein B